MEVINVSLDRIDIKLVISSRMIARYEAESGGNIRTTAMGGEWEIHRGLGSGDETRRPSVRVGFDRRPV